MIFQANNQNIENAIKILQAGHMMIYPTDTLYGLGVDATNTFAIIKINKLKKRKQPLSIIVNSVQMLQQYADVNKSDLKYLKNYLPGPYTFLLNKKNSNLSNMVTLNSHKIGIRIPKSNFILDVVKAFNRPIITTSINLHGQNALNCFEKIKQNFKTIDMFKGDINIESSGSTIIDLTTDQPEIVRRGDGKLNHANLS